MNACASDQRLEIATLAENMLSGSVTYIEGARQVSSRRFAADLEWDEDILPFVGVDSETDALPIDSSVRELWLASALEKLQSEIDKAEQWAREILETRCHNLVRRFGDPQPK